MLLQYGRQLISSRKLIRYRELLGQGDGRGESPPTPETQRKLMVERITREVVDNLIFAGSENPVVLEVRDRLDTELGENFVFQYPPGEMDFKIFREKNGELEEIVANEKHMIMGKLWDITRKTVAETML
ncbi:MAG: hypothetical protein LBQ63_07735 [Deltaproteobacteria bacterium]|jgi:hypothetical protein|nr:hypothetical protein [Deltaproteobacteria bacterium]